MNLPAHDKPLETISALLARLCRRCAASGLLGAYRSHFRGTGLEFEELGEYSPGDEARHIAWQASLRRGHLYRRRFREEREIPLLLVADVSRSVFCWERQRRLQLETAALFAACSHLMHDPCGLYAFSDQPEAYLAPARGLSNLTRMLQTLEALCPAHSATNLQAACASLLQTLKTPTRLVVISDFHDISGDCQDLLRQLSLRHEIMLCWLAETPYGDLPDGVFLEVREAESGHCGLVAAGGQRSLAERRPTLDDLAIACGGELLSLTPDRPPADAVLDYLRTCRTNVQHH